MRPFSYFETSQNKKSNPNNTQPPEIQQHFSGTSLALHYITIKNKIEGQRNMNIIETYAPDQLLYAINIAAENNLNQRCLHIEISKIEHMDEQWRDNTIALLYAYFEDSNTDIYISDDNDIFIMNQRLTPRLTTELASQIAHSLTPGSPQIPATFLYEITPHLHILREICVTKINHAKAQMTKEETSNYEQFLHTRKQDLLNSIDAHLIKTIAERRKQNGRINILLIEKDSFSQRLIQSSLNSRYTLTIAENARSSILKYIDTAPDIVLLDPSLPDTSGLKVITYIRECDPQAHIILLNQAHDRETLLDAISLGAQGFVNKPFDQHKLLNAIEASPFVKTKRALQKQYFQNAALTDEIL